MNACKMREKKRGEFVQECLRDYYDEDKKILLDLSICEVFITQYVLRELSYFGNKLYILKEDLPILKKFADYDYGKDMKAIRGRNAKLILKLLAEKEAAVVNFPDITRTRINKISIFLKKFPNSFFYLQDELLYHELRKKELMKQLHLMYKGMKNIGIFKSEFSFKTIGELTFNNGQMQIDGNNSGIRIFDSKGEEKKEKTKVGDFILITSLNETEEISNLYEIVSNHSKNNACLVLKIKKDDKSYLEELPYRLKKIIDSI